MTGEAIAKLQTEMDQNKNNPYVQVMGDFLIKHINANPGAAEKIINGEKTIVKSLDEMKKAAEKKKVGNCAVLTPQEGFEIVLKYFEVEGPASVWNIEPKVEKAPEASKSKTESDFDIKLEDFM